MKILEREDSNSRNAMAFPRKYKIAEWLGHNDPGRERQGTRSEMYTGPGSCNTGISSPP